MIDSATLLAIIERDREKDPKKLAKLNQWGRGWEACLEHMAALIRCSPERIQFHTTRSGQ